MGPVCARALVACVAIAIASQAGAQQIRVSIHPLVGDSGEAIADAQALLQSAVASAARRGDSIVPAKPLLLPRTCAPKLAAECLAKVAGHGIVVSGTVRTQGGILIVSLRAVDGAGRVVGPLSVGVDAFLQSSEPFARALLQLESGFARAAKVPALEPRTVLAPSAAPPAPNATDSEPGIAAAALKYKEPQPDVGGWRLTTGHWATGVGAVMLAGGVTFALLNQQAANDLDNRFRANTLTPADAAKYRTVATYNVLAPALLVGGGVVTATGLVLWGTAPSVEPQRGGASFGIQGRF